MRATRTGAPTAVAADDPVPEALARDAVAFCARLIRFDTTNHGGGRSNGEREAAEWVATLLSDAGYEPVVLESAPRRASTVVRIAGADPAAPALLVHSHLDVVPAAAADWSVDPFGGEIRDGAVWGRGALDMKDMAAMTLATAVGFSRDGFVPPRDLVLAFVADEEDTGELGAGFLAGRHRSLFRGVRTAIGESGGEAIPLPDGSRLYPIATGERGSAWMRLTARGKAGHGSQRDPDNAVVTLARALVRIADHRWPVHLIPTVRTLVDGLGAQLGRRVDISDPRSLAALGPAGEIVEATLANSLNPTMLTAGYKVNVIPGEATACVDGRILPGTEDEFFATVDALLDDPVRGTSVSREFLSYAAPVGTAHDTAEFALMAAAIRRYDPDAVVLPYCMSGGTDAKAFAALGIACYGFAPGRPPADFRSRDHVHGVDEHVPISSLRFGVHVLDAYLRSAPTAAGTATPPETAPPREDPR